jgi:hypothetical protein
MVTDVSLLIWIVVGLAAFWIVLKIIKKIVIAVLIGLLILAAGVLLRGTLW